MKEVYLYLALNPAGTWELYPGGKPSGVIITKKEIKKLLSPSEWKRFQQGYEFFYVDEEKLRPFIYKENNKAKINFTKFVQRLREE